MATACASTLFGIPWAGSASKTMRILWIAAGRRARTPTQHLWVQSAVGLTCVRNIAMHDF